MNFDIESRELSAQVLLNSALKKLGKLGSICHADNLSLADVISMSDLDSLSHRVIQSFRFSHLDGCLSQSHAVVIQVNKVVCFFLSFFYYFY